MEALINRDPELVENIWAIIDETQPKGKRPAWKFSNAMDEVGND